MNIKSLYQHLFWSLERQAKEAGVKMGQNNFIDSRFWSSEPYLITIGDNCQITAGVRFLTHGGGHVIRNEYPDYDSFGKIYVGNYVYIGNNALIMPGVKIGDNVLVAAGSVVTKSVPSGWVIGGNPARYICSVEDYILRNMKYNTNSKRMNYSDKKRLLESLQEEKFVIKQKMERG